MLTPEELKEVVQEIYFTMLNNGKGLISDHLAKQCALITIEKIREDREMIFNEYGLGFIRRNIVKNDFKKHSLFTDIEKMKKILNNL